METAKRLDGIGEYYFSKKLREIDKLNKEGKNIISLGVGSPDQAPHPEVIQVLNEESKKSHAHGYQSYKGSPILRTAMADWYKRWYGVELNPDTEILPLAGSKEGIMHICMTYINPGDLVLIPNPGYPTYQSAAKLAGGVPMPYELKESENWFPNLDNIKKTIEHRPAGQSTLLMFVNYPHMPTGQVATRNQYNELVVFAKNNKILLINDNPYSFIMNDNPLSMLSDRVHDHVIELNSLSKSHNMAGWRIGLMIASSIHVENVLRFKSNMDSGIFLPLQLAAAKALSLPASWYVRVNEIYATRKKIVEKMLDMLGCKYSSNQAGLFVWGLVPEDISDGYSFSDLLLYQADVFITPGGIFGSAGNRYIRVSLCAPQEKIEESILRIKKAGLLKSQQHV